MGKDYKAVTEYNQLISVRNHLGDDQMKWINKPLINIVVIAMLLPVFTPLFAMERTSMISKETEFPYLERELKRDAPGGWSIEVVDAGPNAGYDISMAMEANGNIHISYYHDNNDKLMYAKWDGTSWSREVLGDMTIKKYATSIALDSSGNPFISACQKRELKLFYKTAGVWKNESLEGGVGSYTGCHSSLAIDSQDQVHISYQNVSTFDLKYIHKSGGNWVSELLDSDNTTGKSTSLALDSSEHPHISYQRTTGGTLRYTKWDGNSWDIETVDDQATAGLHYTSLALDSQDNPHISYFSATNAGKDKYLRYAKWSGTQWIIENADPDRNSGYFSSLVLDEFDRPHISYYGDTDSSSPSNGKLKYSYYDGVAWNITILDGEGDTGLYSSMELDATGKPTISYYDETLKCLKIIRWDEEAPTADAGSDIFIDQHDRAKFNGTASTDNFVLDRFEWTFNENGVPRKLTGIEPLHKFNRAGTYVVTLNASDNAGNWANDTITVTVNDTEKPVADAGIGYYAYQHETVQFNGSACTDNVGVEDFSWTFHYDSVPREIKGKLAEFLFDNAGQYNFTLNVSDAVGNWATSSSFVLIYDITPPAADAGKDVTIGQHETLKLNGSASFDNMEVTKYLWSFTEAGSLKQFTGQEMEYTFHNAGLFGITLNVSDERENWDTDSVFVTVKDTELPKAMAGDNISLAQGHTVVFNASNSTDNVGLVSYEWLFIYDDQSISLKEKISSYTFMDIGVYNVTLRVTDATGNRNEIIVTVNITDGIAPMAVGEVGEIAKFDVPFLLNASNSTDNVDIVSYQWQFRYKAKTKTLWGSETSFRFQSYGTYDIILTVTDRAGNSNKTNFTVKVVNPISGDDTEEPDNVDPSTTGGGTVNKGGSNWVLIAILISVVVILTISGIIIILLVKKKKARELEEEKTKEEKVEERQPTPEEYYAKLYGTSSISQVQETPLSPAPPQGPPAHLQQQQMPSQVSPQGAQTPSAKAQQQRIPPKAPPAQVATQPPSAQAQQQRMPPQAPPTQGASQTPPAQPQQQRMPPQAPPTQGSSQTPTVQPQQQRIPPKAQQAQGTTQTPSAQAKQQRMPPQAPPTKGTLPLAQGKQ